MKTSDFGYELPQDLIAQAPWPLRDQCKMLALNSKTGEIEDKQFFNIEDYLNPGDLLIANETRVFPARLLGKKRGSGGKAEVFLLKKTKTEDDNQYWEALVKPGRRLKPVAEGVDPLNGPIVDFEDCNDNIVLSAQIIDWGSGDQSGLRIVKLFSEMFSVDEAMHRIGKTPLPPYIHNYSGNMEMYQTVYSANESSAAAPTAGLHFTDELINKLKNKGINFETVELEVGIDTFRTVDEEDPRDHKMHTEMYSISKETIMKIEQTKKAGGRVVAVGTTSVRTLESAFDKNLNKLIDCKRKPTSLFILPGYKFNVVNAVITNFHVPESTLMMLVSAFAGYENIMKAYKHAVESKYRFLSFGDSMFIY